mmetsp:Transcript_118930/g.222323  ORF Transcript_118930/g.222323 Transcript_118930/m.222323 type:complete len:80 (-) Transcript_118930:68-307(-)
MLIVLYRLPICSKLKAMMSANARCHSWRGSSLEPTSLGRRWTLRRSHTDDHTEAAEVMTQTTDFQSQIGTSDSISAPPH